MLFTNEKRFTKDPAVIRLGNKYFIYYTQQEGSVYSIGIGMGFSPNEFDPVSSIPLEQPCEEKGAVAPCVILLDGTLHMFYACYGNGARDAICHATSQDGLHFVKDPTNPVFSPSAGWCSGRAIDPDVCVFGNRLLLYFATRDHAMKLQKIGVAAADLQSDFSKGTFKELVHQSVLFPETLWEKQCVEAPATICHDGKIYLFYGGGYNCEPQQIGCAVSDDGIFFKRLFISYPFLPNGSSRDWNSFESGHPYVYEDTDGKIYLYFQGSPDKGLSYMLSVHRITFDEKGMPSIM